MVTYLVHYAPIFYTLNKCKTLILFGFFTNAVGIDISTILPEKSMWLF